MPRRAAFAVLLIAALSAAGTARANPLLEPVEVEDYIPGGGRHTAKPAQKDKDAATPPKPATTAPAKPPTTQPRRGSSTPPDVLAPTAPTRPTSPTVKPPTVAPKDTTGDTARFKQDLMQPGVDALRRDNSLGKLDPFQQRDLFNKEHDLHRLQNDPMRR
jgi:hypothetical protein